MYSRPRVDSAQLDLFDNRPFRRAVVADRDYRVWFPLSGEVPPVVVSFGEELDD